MNQRSTILIGCMSQNHDWLKLFSSVQQDGNAKIQLVDFSFPAVIWLDSTFPASNRILICLQLLFVLLKLLKTRYTMLDIFIVWILFTFTFKDGWRYITIWWKTNCLYKALLVITSLSIAVRYHLWNHACFNYIITGCPANELVFCSMANM